MSPGRIAVMDMAGHGLMVSEMEEKDLDDVGCCLDVKIDTLLVWCRGVASCVVGRALAH